MQGFPRNVEQCEYLESRITELSRVVVFKCSESIIMQRLATRGRWDDVDVDNINRRIKTFREVTPKVLDVFRGADKLVHIEAGQDIEAVEIQFCDALVDILQSVPKRNVHDGIVRNGICGKAFESLVLMTLYPLLPAPGLVVGPVSFSLAYIKARNFFTFLQPDRE